MTFPTAPLVVPQWTDREEINAAKLSARIDTPLNQIQQFIGHAPLGIIAYTRFATTTTYTSATNYLTLSVVLVPGRFYRMTSAFIGVNNSAGAPAIGAGISGIAASTNVMWFLTTGAATTIYGTSCSVFSPPALSTYTPICSITNVVSCTIDAGAYLLIEDIGI